MSDPRHLKRVKSIQNLFAYSFPGLGDNIPYPNEGVCGDDLFEKIPSLDIIIQKYAPRYPLDRIAKTDLAVLRLAVYELLYTDQPKKVIIDEGVKLAKEFGGDKSYAFINAVLGSIMKDHVNSD